MEYKGQEAYESVRETEIEEKSGIYVRNELDYGPAR